MNAATFLRQGGLYTVVLGGGSIAMACLFPAALRPVAVGMLMVVGVFLFGLALVSDDGPKEGGIQPVRDSGDTKRGRGMRSNGPQRRSTLAVYSSSAPSYSCCYCDGSRSASESTADA